MFAQSACITMGGQTFITIEFEVCGGTRQGFGTGVSKSLMPKSGGDGGVEACRRMHQGVEIAGGVTSVKHPSRGQILDRKTKGVKFD